VLAPAASSANARAPLQPGRRTRSGPSSWPCTSTSPPPSSPTSAPASSPWIAAGRRKSPFVILAEAPAHGAKAHPYHTYDAFSHQRCSQCQYLPVCMGGCPKTWFEGNEFYLARRSAYWEENFEGLIRLYAETAAAPA
jgi:hypothetical protein